MSLDPPKPLPPKSPSEDVPFPRLGIRHWLLWTLLTATVYAGLQYLPDYIERSMNRRRPSALHFLSAAALAAALIVASPMTGMIFARRSIRGFSAGHWLALRAAVVGVLQFAMHRLPVLSQTLPILLVIWLIPDLISAVAARYGRQHWVWRGFFLGLIATSLFGLAFHLTFFWFHRPFVDIYGWSTILLVANAVLTLIYLLAFAVDLVERRRKDWAHWVGVLLPALHTAEYILAEYILQTWLFYGQG